MTRSFQIRLSGGKRRTIGGKAPCFIVAEIGTNWHFGDGRDSRDARRLIDVAAEAGCDAVKFQTYRPDQVYAPNAGKSDYLSAAGIRRSIAEVIAERVMPADMVPELAAHATKRGVVFMSSCFSVEDLALIDRYAPLHKLASYEISHLRLIDALAATGKPLVMSTGAAAPADIAWAVRRFRRGAQRPLALLQCTARYPAPDEAMNLRTIPWLARRFDCVVGLSDHSAHPLHAPLAAVALGAKIVEKHITLDKRSAGPDHFNSLDPAELTMMVAGIRSAEAMLGDGVKRIEPAERELRRFAHRSVQATRAIGAGETLREGENMAILRPGKRRPGAHPSALATLQNKHARRRVAAGDGITLDVVRAPGTRPSRKR